MRVRDGLVTEIGTVTGEHDDGIHHDDRAAWESTYRARVAGWPIRQVGGGTPRFSCRMSS
jgi:hypothetical protein